MTKRISADELRKRFSGTDEYSLIDVREQGEFSKGHLLMACCIPLSRMELVIDDLVPGLATPIVLVDDEHDSGCRIRSDEDIDVVPISLRLSHLDVAVMVVHMVGPCRTIR